MSQARDTALVLCPAGVALHRRLLGLTLGERLLLALSHAGITRVAFAGSGSQPASDRAGLTVIAPTAIGTGDVLVIAADLVFDRGLVKAETIPGGLPIGWLPAATAGNAAADPDGWLAAHPARSTDVPGYAIRVGDDAAARVATRAVLRSLRKPIDGLVSRHLNRYVSIFLSSLLVRTGVSPNPLTIVFTLVGLASGVLAAVASPWWMVPLAALLVQLQSILDGCDGEIARLTYRFSKTGQWLDSIGDDITNYAFCFGLAIGQARVLGEPALLWAGGITLAAQCLASAVLYRRMIILGTGDLLAIPDTVTTADGALAGVIRVLRQIAKRDTFVLVIAVLAVIHPVVAFAVYAAGTFPMVVGVVINDRRLSRAQHESAPPAPIAIQA